MRKAPATFAALAKAQSQDPSSAELGGDLGLIEKDALPAPVESAVFKLKQGEISELVESDFGFHIIHVTSVVPATTKTIDEVKPQIVAELKKSKMSKKYSELAELFTNTVYEQSDSLKPVADKLKLKIETIDNLSRTPSPALGTSQVNNPKFLKAIFSDDALKNKRNTEAVEVAPTTLVAGRVIEFKPDQVLIQAEDQSKYWWLPYAAVQLGAAPPSPPEPPPVQPNRHDFAIGDTVSFEGRDLIQRIGTIVRINQKTASLMCDGQQWRVSFQLLRHVVNV